MRKPLPKGTIISGREGVFTITGGPIGEGGSSLIYPAEKIGDLDGYIIKECYPTPFEINGTWHSFERAQGEIHPSGKDDKEAELFLGRLKERMRRERMIGGDIHREVFHVIPLQDEITDPEIKMPDGTDVPHSRNLYLTAHRISGCMLQNILDECAADEDAEHPLRNGVPGEMKFLPSPPRIHTIAEILCEILSTLAKIHGQGKIHGDIQPGNICFEGFDPKEGAIGQAVFLDFASARDLQDDGHGRPRCEEIRDQMVFTTPGYTAPEILEHNDGHLRLTAAADIYSVGRLFLAMITRRSYVSYETDGTPVDSMRNRPELARVGIQDLERTRCRCSLIGDVNAILRKSLADDSERRYPDATAMLADMRSLMNRTAPPEWKLTPNLVSYGKFLPGSRKEELAGIRKAFQEKKHPVFLWGFGGIGKTELAVQYAEARAQGSEAYLVIYNGNMRKTILGLDFCGRRYTITPEEMRRRHMTVEEAEEEIYRHNLKILSELPEDDLLILDNFDEDSSRFVEMANEPAFKELLACTRMKLLITTRAEIPACFCSVHIGSLGRENLLRLMRTIYTGTAGDDILKELIDEVQEHTMTVSMIASALQASLPRITPEELLSALKDWNVDSGTPEVIESKYGSKGGRMLTEATIGGHLRALFRVSGLSETCRNMMRDALLISPKYGMDYTLFTSAHKTFNKNDMDSLLQRGWILDNQSDCHILHVHPVVMMACREELMADSGKCMPYLERLWNLCDTDRQTVEGMQVAGAFELAVKLSVNEFVYAYYAAYLYRLNVEYRKACLLIQEAIAKLGKYFLGMNATKFGEIMNKTGQEVISKQEVYILNMSATMTAEIFNEAGNIFSIIGTSEETNEAYTTSLSILHELSKFYPEKVLTTLGMTCNNYGMFCVDNGQFEKANKLFMEAMNIHRELAKDDSEEHLLHLAATCINYGRLCGESGWTEKAEKLYTEGLGYYRKLAEAHPEVYLSYLAESCTNYASFCLDTKRQEEAERLCVEALGYCRKLVEMNPGGYLLDLAVACNNYGISCMENGQTEKAENLYTEALGYYRTLAETHPEVYLSYLASSCNNYANFCRDNNRMEAAKGLYTETIGCYRKLVKIRPKRYLSDLAMACNNYGIFCKKNGQTEEAEKFFAEALCDYRKLAKEYPEKYLHKFISICDNLGYCCIDNEWPEGTNQVYMDALNICRKFATAYPKLYLHDLAMICNIYGIFCADKGKLEDAEKLLEEALGHYRKLVEKNPELYLPELAEECNTCGNFCENMRQLEEADKLYKEALKCYRKLVEMNPDMYLKKLAATCNNYGKFYKDNNHLEEADNLYREALDILRKLVEIDFIGNLPYLAATCSNYGIFCTDNNRPEEAEKLCVEALGYYRQLVEVNPEEYLSYLASACNNYGNYCAVNGRIEEADRFYKETFGIWTKLVKTHPKLYLQNLYEICSNYGFFCEDNGKTEEADKLYFEAIEIQRKLSKIQPEIYLAELAEICGIYGNFCEKNRRIDKAEKLYEEALEYYRKLAVMQPNEYLPFLGEIMRNYLGMCRDNGQLEKALHLAEEAKEIIRMLENMRQ